MLSQKADGKRLLLTGMLLVLFFFCFQMKADASWVKNENGTYSWYTKKGKLAKNRWVKKKYYVDANGVRVTGLQKIGSKYYFFNKFTGELIKGVWIKSGSKYYCAKSDGVLYRKGRYKIDGEYYYFGKTGRLKYGLIKIGSKSYYFDNSSGRMVKKTWVEINGSYYYFNKNGVMKKNAWVGKRYVGSDGARLYGLQVINGKYYYLSDSTGKKVTGTTKTVSGVTYEFDSSGVGTVKSTSVVATNGRSHVNGMNDAYYTDPVVSDEVLLAALIYCETDNQDYEGQLAVGMVVVNRVRSSKFPDTFAQVIYQTDQFTPAGDSSGYARLTEVLNHQSRISSSCKEAAAEAMKRYKKGTETSIVEEEEIEFPYLFFCTEDSYNALGLTASYLEIGDHRFFTKWC